MSKIAELLRNDSVPVAVYRTSEPPVGEVPDPGLHCVISSMLFPAAREGKTVVAKKDEIPCSGAYNGFGFGGEPGRERNYCGYSTGTEESPGRHYFKNEDIAKTVLDQVNVYGDDSGYIVLQPIDEAVGQGRPVETVVFLVDPMRFSALTTLAGYDSTVADGCNVKVIHALACEEIYALPKAESGSENPKAILGLTELFVRKECRPQDMTFAVPYAMYLKMEANAEESFLNTRYWKDVVGKDGGCDCC